MDIAEHPIPPETVPIVLEAWGWTLAEQVEPLSIRDALWVSRLYYIIKKIWENIYEGMSNDNIKQERWNFIHTLILLAKGYALHEIKLKLIGDEHPKTPEDMWASWSVDGYVHASLTHKNEVKDKCLFEYEKRFPGGEPLDNEVVKIMGQASSKLISRTDEIIRLDEEELEKLEAEAEGKRALLQEIRALSKEIDEIRAQGTIPEEKKARLKEIQAKFEEIRAQWAKLDRQKEVQNEGKYKTKS